MVHDSFHNKQKDSNHVLYVCTIEHNYQSIYSNNNDINYHNNSCYNQAQYGNDDNIN